MAGLEGLEWTKRPVARAVGIGTFAALSTVLNFGTIWLTFWGMKIDLVAVPWVIAWVLFGYEAALICALISIPTVSFVGFGVTGLVGGTMKFIASVWMFSVPAVVALASRKTRLTFIRSPLFFVPAAVLAIVVRDLVCVFFNFYFALPVFLGLDVGQVVEFMQTSPFTYWVGISGLAVFIFEIVFWNSVQGLIDMFLSWAVTLAVAMRLLPRSGIKQRRLSL